MSFEWNVSKYARLHATDGSWVGVGETETGVLSIEGGNAVVRMQGVVVEHVVLTKLAVLQKGRVVGFKYGSAADKRAKNRFQTTFDSVADAQNCREKVAIAGAKTRHVVHVHDETEHEPVADSLAFNTNINTNINSSTQIEDSQTLDFEVDAIARLALPRPTPIQTINNNAYSQPQTTNLLIDSTSLGLVSIINSNSVADSSTPTPTPTLMNSDFEKWSVPQQREALRSAIRDDASFPTLLHIVSNLVIERMLMD